MLTEDNCCSRNLTNQNLMDSNSSSFSPETSPILGNNSSDVIHDKSRKRQYNEFINEEDNLFINGNESINNLLFMQNKQPKFDMNRLKCPCCSEQIAFNMFPSHACFRQQITAKKAPPLLQPSNGQADLSILFTIFQGSELFKKNLLNRIQNLLPNDLIANHTALLGCLAIELFAQSLNQVEIASEVRNIFNFFELQNLQNSNLNNICQDCNPKVCFLLPSSKALHLSLHHYEKSINNPTYLSIILTVNAISLIGCVRLAIDDCLEKKQQLNQTQNLFNSPTVDLLDKMKNIFIDNSNQASGFLKDFSSLLPNLEIMLNLMPNLQSSPVGINSNIFPNNNNSNTKTSKIFQTDQQSPKASTTPTMNSSNTNNNSSCQQTSKRGRTRLTSHQLTILRSYFDINNSPTEDKIIEICSKTGLQEKVVKHWFRNTLFKERQRNKDNPYNFSIPPSTSLNLEEYEKTGKIEFVPNEKKKSSETSSKLSSDDFINTKQDEIDSNKNLTDKMTEINQNINLLMGKCPHCTFAVEPLMNRIQPKILTNHIISKHPEESAKLLSSLKLTDLDGKLLTREENPIDLSIGQLLTMNRELNSAMTNPNSNIFQQVCSSFTNTANSESQDEEFGLQSSEHDSLDGNQNMSNSTSNSANGLSTNNSSNLQSRRNRTSISNFQSKCMFAIYEYHKTPSVQECDRLGDFIGLSRRVVQVWFQNQRAKEKKMARVNQCSMKNSSLNQSSSPNGQPTAPLNLCTTSNCILCSVQFTGDLSDDPLNGPNRRFDRKLIEHLFTSQHLENLIELYSKEMKGSNGDQSM